MGGIRAKLTDPFDATSSKNQKKIPAPTEPPFFCAKVPTSVEVFALLKNMILR